MIASNPQSNPRNKMDEYGTAASIDGMLSVMIIVTGLAFMFSLPGLIGFSSDMQQGFQIIARSIQAMDIGKAIIITLDIPSIDAAVPYSYIFLIFFSYYCFDLFLNQFAI